MIEGALVYILSAAPPNHFVGCGAVIEGGLIATCRHVWRDALAKAPDGAVPLVDFPRAPADMRRQLLTLVAACDDEALLPDLVLLRPAVLPSGTPARQLAMTEALEPGEAAARTMIKGRGKEATVRGVIDAANDPDGRRQFTGQANQTYWFEHGSSGSPLFCRGGQQLAGLVSLSEINVNEGKNHLREAFVVPGTTIRRFAERLAAQPAAVAEHIDPATLRPVLDAIGVTDIPVREIPLRLIAFVESARERAAQPLPPSSDGGDITATLAAARERLGRLDPQGARDLLEARLAEERVAHAQRLLPLLREQVAIARMTYAREDLLACLAEIVALTPDETWAWLQLGDAWRIAGDLTQAIRAFRAAEQVATRMGEERNLAISYNKIGDVLRAQGDGVGALAIYRAAMEIAERLAAADPGNTEWQRDLSIGNDRIGDVLAAQGDGAGALVAYRAAVAIRERLAAAGPSKVQPQRDLSVSHIKIGDVLFARGDSAGALTAYRMARAITGRLSVSDPANAEWQRDFSVSEGKIGDVLVAQGDAIGALAAYRAARAIAERLVATDPANAQWQRDLLVDNLKIGDVLRAQNDRPGAIAAYRAALAIAERLAASDPANAEWQRDLSNSHSQIGDMKLTGGDPAGALAAYQFARATAERLAASDPANTEWQRDLSVSYEKVGDVLRAQGDLTGALAAYRAAIPIAERLAAADPANAGWQRDFSVIHNKIGDMLQAQGNGAGALAAYRAAMAIAERLAAADPANAEWQRDLIVSCVKLAEAAPEEAVRRLGQALALACTLAGAGRLAPVDDRMRAELQRRLDAARRQSG